MKDLMGISEEIKKIRHTTMMSQTEFVEKYNAMEPTDLRLTQQSYSRIERGMVTPLADRYKKLLQMSKFSRM